MPTLLATILTAGAIFAVLVFVHELGHLLAAKAVGIRVHSFGIGFGPKLLSFRLGETEYRLCLLPLGGYVEPDETPGAPGSMRSKTPLQRAFVLVAGVVMNAVLAVAVFATIGWMQGKPSPVPARVQVFEAAALPEGTEPLATLAPATRIVSVKGTAVEDWDAMRMEILMAGGGPAELGLEGGKTLLVNLPVRGEDRGRIFDALFPAFEAEVHLLAPGAPAERAGLKVGHRIVSVDGVAIAQAHDVIAAVRSKPGTELQLVVQSPAERGAVALDTLLLTTEARPAVTASGEQVQLGYAGFSMEPRVQHLSLLESAHYGVTESIRWVKLTVVSIFRMSTGTVSPRDMGGPVAIGQATHNVVQVGTPAILMLLAILSINLAVVNLLPIPILDGGQLLLTAIEAVRGRRLTAIWERRVMNVGVAMVIMLMGWAFLNDILKLFGI